MFASDNYCNSPKQSGVDVTVLVTRDRGTFFQPIQRYIISERAAVNSTVPGNQIRAVDTDLQVKSREGYSNSEFLSQFIMKWGGVMFS